MDLLLLKAELREFSGKKVKNLRQSLKVPAVLYGHDVKNQNLSVDNQQFIKLYKKAGSSSLVDLQISDKKPVKVLIQDIQRDPVTEDIIHIDFHQVKMTEKITAEVEILFVGEPPAVKELGGILVKNISKLKIECLPENLVNKIEVDITSLKTFEDMVKVKDLKLAPGIEVKAKPEEVVANVQPPRSEEELKELEEKVEEKVEEVAEAGAVKEATDEEAAAGEEKPAAVPAEKKEDKKQK